MLVRSPSGALTSTDTTTGHHGHDADSPEHEQSHHAKHDPARNLKHRQRAERWLAFA